MLVEELGFAVSRFHYYRQTHVVALRATYSALGTHVTQAKVVSYNPARDEMIVRVAWT